MLTQAPTLETPRLLLRQFTLDDYDALAACWASPETVKYIGGQRRIKSNFRTAQSPLVLSRIPGLTNLPVSQLTDSRDAVQTNIIDALELTGLSNHFNHQG